MRTWMTSEAALVFEWVRNSTHDRTSLVNLAKTIGRTPEAIVHFLRRKLPPEMFPWRRKPRWRNDEERALREGGDVAGRSRDAVYKYAKRKHIELASQTEPADERRPLTVKFVAESLGMSRAKVYRLLDQGILKRFKGGIAESSFEDLLKEHPEVIPFHTLSRDMQEWLVVMGYEKAPFHVNAPSVQGLLR